MILKQEKGLVMSPLNGDHSAHETLGGLFTELHKISCKKLAILREIAVTNPSAAFMCGLSQKQIECISQLSTSEIMSLIDVSEINKTMFNLSLTERSLDQFVRAVKDQDTKSIALSFAS